MGIIGKIAILLLGVGPAFQLALALPQGGPLQCVSPTTTTTNTIQGPRCLIPCRTPTSICSAGEPTGKLPDPPTTTTVTSANDCTAVVDINKYAGCDLCPTCASVNPGGPIIAVTVTSLAARIIPTPPAYSCTVITTLTKIASPPLCKCPMFPESCPPGETTFTPPLPTSTVTDVEGCAETVVVGPGCQCRLCEA